MNYRHAFHAGNFADVFKHAFLALILTHLTRKDAALRYLDTHAGVGLYDLTGEEATRSGEAADGIARLDADPPQGEAERLLAPYLETVAAARAAHGPTIYPGSPWIAARLTRPQDRLTLCELNPQERETLTRAMRRDARVGVVGVDGYVALGAYVPPKERRGLVLVDPPFESRDEFSRMAAALVRAHRKWPTGVYALWHPVKHVAEARGLADAIAAAGVRRVLRLELVVGAAGPPPRGGGPPLIGAGLVLVNPPFGLEAQARALLPFLAARLGRDGAPSWRVDVVAGE
ncbi:MAG: 23S rRNA (adenine(2030)-N(6))-methyltransferase RlmJ [Methylobacteriaceae bacterium]|nr:23S rRNA (adenine(2030)-N(6))-methyltransferase RlmJ [Methylobacteriaceae bacterium]